MTDVRGRRHPGESGAAYDFPEHALRPRSVLTSAPLTRSYKSKFAAFRKGIRQPQRGDVIVHRLPGHNIYRGINVQKKSSIALLSAAMLAAGVLGGCATESSRSVQVAKVESASRPYVGVRTPIAVGKFDNRSAYMRGVFSDNVDRLGSQAKTILITHLQQTQRFNVLDRDNMAEIRQEADIKKTQQTLKGADYVITGDVVEFGRKEVGDKQLFGILGRGREQVAYAKVNLNVVNIATSEVVYSSGGAGEFALSNREVIGFGGTAGYDSTLNGKVLDLAMREAVNNLVAGIESGAWTPGK
ncbi:Putative lipoprotein NMB1126/NMB1164 precursor [Pandoraea pulmonicola]|uniref:Lipoprotein NMB1126/NMB1164 n=2 Tax=Pandoraea pulmonicola TaxID=93221 RepID=A0AAJ5D2B5_PANPU|nr:Putative lipoprotein NMB1126/NMB1164 precursor [Pandoraea pulmonicola]